VAGEDDGEPQFVTGRSIASPQKRADREESNNHVNCFQTAGLCSHEMTTTGRLNAE
jgi:hypothetical protein